MLLCSSTSSEAPCGWKAVSGILWQPRQAWLSASGSPATRPFVQLNLPLPLLVWQASQFPIALCALASGPGIRNWGSLANMKAKPTQMQVTIPNITARRSRE